MIYYNNTGLYHHGIKGQKWGVRRFKKQYSKEKKKNKLKKVAKIAGISVGVVGALLIGKVVAEHFIQKGYNMKALKSNSEHVEKGRSVIDGVIERSKSVDPKKLRWHHRAVDAAYNRRRKIWDKYGLLDKSKIRSKEEKRSMLDELDLLDKQMARIRKKLGTEFLAYQPD